MLAKDNEYIQSAVVTLAELTEDEQIRQRCQARRDFESRERKRLNQIKKDRAELTATKTELASTKAELADKNAELAALRAELAALKASN